MPCLSRRIVGRGKQLVAVRHVGSEQELCTLALVRDGGSCILSASSSSCVVTILSFFFFSFFFFSFFLFSFLFLFYKLDLVHYFVQIGFNECLFAFMTGK